MPDLTNAQLKERLAQADEANKETKATMKAQGEDLRRKDAEISELKESLAKLQSKKADLDTPINLGDRETTARELLDMMNRPEGVNTGVDQEYVLEAVMNETREPPIPTTVSRYDGLAYDAHIDSEGNVVPDSGTFLFHEALSFREYDGYSESAIQDWCRHSVSRATDPQRLGTIHRQTINVGQRQVTVAETPCANLPPFNPNAILEVIVRVLPVE